MKPECVKILCSLLSFSFPYGPLSIYFLRTNNTGVIFLFWLFQLIFFGFFLADFWEKHKKWLIPVIVIAVLFMIPCCVYIMIDDHKMEKKHKERERQRYDNMQQFLQQN